MTRGVQRSLVCFIVFIALIALAGCSHFLFAEREPWRHDSEIACLNTGAVKETPQRVRISAISGPGICGMDYPLRIAALGDNAPLAYDSEPPRPPISQPAPYPKQYLRTCRRSCRRVGRMRCREKRRRSPTVQNRSNRAHCRRCRQTSRHTIRTPAIRHRRGQDIRRQCKAASHCRLIHPATRRPNRTTMIFPVDRRIRITAPPRPRIRPASIAILAPLSHCRRSARRADQ